MQIAEAGEGHVDQGGYRRLRIGGKNHFEHRLVMERHLGRKLLPNETVHHRDGDKLNNDITNLELWITNHLAGVRADEAQPTAPPAPASLTREALMAPQPVTSANRRFVVTRLENGARRTSSPPPRPTTTRPTRCCGRQMYDNARQFLIDNPGVYLVYSPPTSGTSTWTPTSSGIPASTSCLLMAAPSFIRAVTGLTDATGAWTSAPPLGHRTSPSTPSSSFRFSRTEVPAEQLRLRLRELQLGGPGWDYLKRDLHRLVLGGRLIRGYSASLDYASAANQGTASIGTNSTSEDLYFRAYAFSDVSTGTTLATVIENIGGTDDLYANGAGTGTTISDTGVTTSGLDRLALQLVAAGDDIAIDAFA